MSNASRRRSSRGVLRLAAAAAAILTLALGAHAQSDSSGPSPAVARQLSRLTFAISGTGEFTTTTTGTNYLGYPLTDEPSNTLGALVTLRYIARPYFGLEFNFGYARYTENDTTTAENPGVGGAAPLILGIQTNAKEYSFGYVFSTRDPHFGVKPFASLGAGTLAFTPTPGGGQGYGEQARAAYYYDLGADAPILGDHFGVRVQFRQVYFLAPDYETNYLRDLKHSITTEPSFGFYIHY